MLLQATRKDSCLVLPSGILIKGTSTYIRFRWRNSVRLEVAEEDSNLGSIKAAPTRHPRTVCRGSLYAAQIAARYLGYCAGAEVAAGVACFVPLVLPPPR